MTLRNVEIFLALARTPNMRDAAAKLFISQAAVSSALRDFEAELGVSLFDRMGRGIRLNDKGRLLEERLAPLYNQLKNVLALVASDELAGKIRIGASTTLSDFVLPQVLYNFKMRHHQVEIECESGNTADMPLYARGWAEHRQEMSPARQPASSSKNFTTVKSSRP